MNHVHPIDPPAIASDIQYRPATLDDCAAVVDVLNAYAQVTRGIDEFEIEEIRSEWTQPGFDLATASQVAVTSAGRIVGYADIWDMEEVPVKPMIFGRVHPDYEGRGIGTELMRWLEVRARQVLPRVPAAARVATKTGVPANHAASCRLLESCGMQVTRYTWEMSIDLTTPPPAPQWPQGMCVRTHADLGDALAVYRVKVETFLDHRDSVPISEDRGFPLWLHRMTDEPHYDPSLWFLAMDGSEIVAVSLCKVVAEGDTQVGWVQTLGVRRAWRRQGVGLALLHHTFGEFHRRGVKRVSLHVDASSLTGATRLYERAGMYMRESYAMFEKELRPGVELSIQAVKAE